jgi:hypothetical protein
MPGFGCKLLDVVADEVEFPQEFVRLIVST